MIFVLDPICEEAILELRRHHNVVAYPESRRRPWQPEAEAVILRTASRVTAADIAAAKRLKVIGKHGTGVDNIDLEAARQRGVRVVNTPMANSNAVAEMTLALILALTRGIPRSDRLIREGKAEEVKLEGMELRGRCIGILGFGQVGRRVARLFRLGFGCRVVAFDPFAAPERFAEEEVERADSLDALLAMAEVVTVHAPLNAETRGLIGARELARMRPGAFLINVARGGIVDEAALAAALEKGPLAGAASDVFVEEPPPATHPLLARPNFIATYHLAATTREAMLAMGLGAAKGVLDALAGRRPEHLVV